MYGRVESTTRLTPDLVRVVLGGEGLSGFSMAPGSDAYINIAVPPADAPYGPVFDPAEVRGTHDRELQPARRRYTVRAWDAEKALLTVDFVVHGTAGVAGPWAANAEVGDVLVFEGPAGAWRPDPGADWHLMIGDESALPAIAASLEIVPSGRRVVVLLVCDSVAHEIALETPGDLGLVWLHRNEAAQPETLLLTALEQVEFGDGRVDVFVHGEADEIRGIRRHLLTQRGIDRSTMSCSPYWRRTMTDEAWRAVKRDFVEAMDADVS